LSIVGIAPCDFWLFPNLKFGLKGEHFATIEIIKANVTDNLRAIPIEGYQRWFVGVSVSLPKDDILKEIKLI